MSRTLTIDDIWKLFEETNRLFRESAQRAEQDRQRAEQDRQRAEQERQRAEQERQQRAEQERQQRAEQERQWAEQDRQRAEQDRQRAEQDRQRVEQERRQADEEWQEIKRKMKESGEDVDRRIREVSQQIGQLGSRWGDFVEGVVAPACETLFAERGIPVHSVSRQVKAKRPGNRHMEVDILVVNTDTVVLVEVKSKLRHEDVREHLTRVAQFKEMFPVYANMRVMGAVAGIVIEENVDRFAMNEGLFVIVQSGEGVQLANEASFVPHAW